MNRIPAVILAGGGAKPEMAAATGVESRALIPFRGRPMVQHVIDALNAADSVGDVYVIGDHTGLADATMLRDSGGFVENLFTGMEACRESSFAIVATADTPFLTPESVDDLARRGVALNADIVYPVVPVRDCYARFPGIKRTAARLCDGEFTGGNAVLARPSFLLSNRSRIQEAYAARKTPLRLAVMLGIGVVVRFAVSQCAWPGALTIARLEAAVGRLLGGTARALISPYPEIATDIDRPSDLEALRGER